ncbi:hypothetical protein NEUTE1DRAFT_92460 [Neurospora tetrasperma FGSC 2508]|uniref:Uncharacterized protein n=1 Tax=Neurospora tetrasperma (strain FGSC 2508 / ATCC MYA-4615 / P0657) TaxID=510951 RepID=F8N2C0_NEUT8|nr:uncharacterized protein NEUTE1DRAFT_92460 [Neurospora tetrasperma FGSC 2508]EGO53291.1 hypothetical protein NEUTE1DRAFT_92460 [Neurospora tetrasperma FGSC 2508]
MAAFVSALKLACARPLPADLPAWFLAVCHSQPEGSPNPSSVPYTTSMATVHGHSMSKSGVGRDYITDLYIGPPRRPPQRPPRWPPLPTSRHSRGTSLPPLVIPNNASPAPRPLSEFRPKEASATVFLNFSLPRPVACRKKSSVDITASNTQSTHLSVPNTNSTHGESNHFSSNAGCVPPPPKSPQRPSTSRGHYQIPPPLPTPNRPLSSGSDSIPSRPLSSGSDQVPELEPDFYNDDVSIISDAAQTPPPPTYAPPSPPVKSPLRPWSVGSSYSQVSSSSSSSSGFPLHRSSFYPGKRNPPPRINFRPSSQAYYPTSRKSVPNLRQQSESADDSTGSEDNDTTTTTTTGTTGNGRRQPKTYKLDARSRRRRREMSPSDVDLDDPTARECSKAEAEAFTQLIGIIDRFNAREGGSPSVPDRLARRVSSLHLRVATPVFDPADEQRELWAKGLRKVSPTVYVADVDSVWGYYFNEEDTPI